MKGVVKGDRKSGWCRVVKAVRIDDSMRQGGYMLLEKDGAIGGGSGVEIGTFALSGTVVITFELK